MYFFCMDIGGQLSKVASSSLSYKSQHSSSDADQSDLQYLNAHPKPLAVSTDILS